MPEIKEPVDRKSEAWHLWFNQQPEAYRLGYHAARDYKVLPSDIAWWKGNEAGRLWGTQATEAVYAAEREHSPLAFGDGWGYDTYLFPHLGCSCGWAGTGPWWSHVRKST